MHDHGRLSVVHISKHSLSSWCWNSQDHGRLPDKHMYPSIHFLHSADTQDHGRLPVVHISKHSHKTCIHVVDSLVRTAKKKAVGTSTCADACVFTSDLLWNNFSVLRTSYRIQLLSRSCSAELCFVFGKDGLRHRLRTPWNSEHSVFIGHYSNKRTTAPHSTLGCPRHHTSKSHQEIHCIPRWQIAARHGCVCRVPRSI